MKFRAFLAALALTLAGLVVPAAALSAPADAAVHHRTHHHKGHQHKARHHKKARHTTRRTTVTSTRHACTTTSSGSCIRGGQFCPSASKNHSGWDASNRRYVCRGGSHPHWEIP